MKIDMNILVLICYILSQQLLAIISTNQSLFYSYFIAIQFSFHFQPTPIKYIYFIQLIPFCFQYCLQSILQMSEAQESGLKNYKTIIIGRSSVGKSTILLRYVDGEYNPQKPTVGIDYRFKKVTYKEVNFNLQLWDSAGQERYRTIVYNYFNLSKAACIVFDLTNQDSLNDAKTWLQQLILHCGNEIPKILLGNKSDLLTPTKLAEQIQKYKEKIDQLKKEYNCQFFAVSALSGEGINQAFGYLIKQIYEQNKLNINVQVQKGMKLDTMRKSERKEGKKDKKCC